jgi:hypothetical protein
MGLQIEMMRKKCMSLFFKALQRPEIGGGQAGRNALS